jgi:phospholipid transport system substrate-binding protein
MRKGHDAGEAERIEACRTLRSEATTPPTMRFCDLVTLWSAIGLLAVAVPAHAEDAQAFIQREHAQLETILHKPDSPARDAEVNQALDGFVDYGEMTRRAFGEPCHPSLAGCEDLWAQLDESQRREVGDLLKQLVRKSYRKNLLKTLNYDIAYKGMKDQGGDTRVITEAQDRSKPHDPPVRVDYIVRQSDRGLTAADFVTEGSSLVKNYYTQFRTKMHNPNEGYPNIVAKLREKIAKKD